ncbi:MULTISPECIES: LacI family DNA-binding transcriptional regulator [unclassified Rathayibacter]|uniref:LacI family DNA-binding transcriptional regulator n=1 Tax=unclassified Rathayibacter TaxID=2609250 RepID=UPI000F4B6AD1|nr:MULTISPECIES: LacI family DNA-binding transcriptional regulator [unclassified Rathayibacter]
MDDVGRLAGVTHQTVSRFLNDKGYVKEETRARIEDAIKQLGYRQNRIARSLALDKSDAVGLLAVRGPGNGIFEDIVHGIGRAATEAGYSVTIVNLEVDPDAPAAEISVAAALENMLSAGIDGLIVLSGFTRVLDVVIAHGATLPVMLLSSPETPGLGLTVIDSFRGGEIAAEHLIALGHRRVIHVRGAANSFEAAQRELGFRAGFARVGVEPRVLQGQWTALSGYELGSELAAQRDFTAVFTGNDQMALGVLHAFDEHSIGVPDEVSVIGYDDIDGAAHFHPPLTSLRQDFEGEGYRAFQALLDMLGGAGSTPRVVLDPELVVRASTGPVGAASA